MVGHPAYTRRWLQIRAQSWFESKWGYQRIKLVVSKLTSYLFDLTNNYTSVSYAQTRYGSLWEKGDCAAG